LLLSFLTSIVFGVKAWIDLEHEKRIKRNRNEEKISAENIAINLPKNGYIQTGCWERLP
jgi:hypothetical protein